MTGSILHAGRLEFWSRCWRCLLCRDRLNQEIAADGEIHFLNIRSFKPDQMVCQKCFEILLGALLARKTSSVNCGRACNMRQLLLPSKIRWVLAPGLRIPFQNLECL